MAKKSGLNFKQLLTQKGEKIGFFACAGLLVAFLVLGGYVASRAASSGDIVKDIDSKVASVRSKTTSGPSDPPPLDGTVLDRSAKLPRILFTEYVTENPYFNVAEDQQQKRMNPRILPLTESYVDFVRGSMPVLDIVEDPGLGILIGVKGKRAKTATSRKIVNYLLDPRRPRAGQQAAAPPPPPPPPPPVAPGPGGRMGGGGGRNEGGGMPGPTGSQAAQSTEIEIKYKSINDEDIDSAIFAENILPKRMVVVTASIPYKKQVDEYVRALRARSPQELSAGDIPLYRGYSVQRQTWTEDHKELKTDWTDVDLVATAGKLFNIVLEFEPEVYSKDLTLAPFYPRIVPDPSTNLVMPRPKLKRGTYSAVELPAVEAALKSLKDLGGNAGQLRNRTQSRLDPNATNPFAPPVVQQPGGTGVSPMPGAPGGRPVVPGPGGRDPGGRDPGGREPGGAFGGEQRGPGGPNMTGVALESEDAWLLRFIDVTVEPGLSYKYQIRLKVANPNYRKPVKELAIPKFAEDQELESPWYQLPNFVDVPADEFLYAAAKDDHSRRVTEKLIQETPDTTYLQFQRWADFVRPNPEQRRMEPIGEWLVANIKAHRGEYVSETAKIKVPFWSLVASSYLFREVLPPKAPSSGVFINQPKPRADATWPIDFTPFPQMLLVDFEGGNGTFAVARKQIADQSGVEMLLLSDDGKLTVKRSQADLMNHDRRVREELWVRWLTEVQMATDGFRNRGNLPPPGTPAAPGASGAPGAGGTGSGSAGGSG